MRETASKEPVRISLGGRRYVIVLEQSYEALRAAASGAGAPDSAAWAAWQADANELGARLANRRRAANLTQTQLARAAGIRVETVNRIERGKTTPDFATVRKLVKALQKAKV